MKYQYSKTKYISKSPTDLKLFHNPFSKPPFDIHKFKLNNRIDERNKKCLKGIISQHNILESFMTMFKQSGSFMYFNRASGNNAKMYTHEKTCQAH
jgi:hypothetical protein